MSPWYWLALGVALIAFEAFTPGVAALWLGASALLVALVVWLVPAIDWQLQLAAFAILAVLSVVLWFTLGRRATGDPAASELNRRAAQQLGATGTLVGPLAHGHGRARLGDTTWSVTGPDLPDGCTVRVVAVEDGRLRVAAVDAPGDAAGPAP
jgi:membrane protein implicated in regulation of membrane protease activity